MGTPIIRIGLEKHLNADKNLPDRNLRRKNVKTTKHLDLTY